VFASNSFLGTSSECATGKNQQSYFNKILTASQSAAWYKALHFKEFSAQSAPSNPNAKLFKQ
jgi:hypothetical protein